MQKPQSLKGTNSALPAERGHPDHDREATSSIPQSEVRNALLGQREVLEHGGRPVAPRRLGADPHPDRCWVVILEEANQLPGLLVERVVEPDSLRVRRNLHVDTLRSDHVVIVVVRGPHSANANHPGLVAFIHFHRHLQPEVIFHVDIERSGVIRLQKRRCDLCRQGERLLVVNLGQQNWRGVVGQLPVRVTEIVPPRFTRKSQPAILNLGMSGGSVERASKGDSRQRDAARFTLHIFGRRLAEDDTE